MVQHTATMALHAKGMGGIVDHLQVVVVGNFLNSINITRVAITMYGHDGCGLRSNGSLDLGGIKVQRYGLYVNKHRGIAVPVKRVRGGYKAVRSGDDFARDAQRLQGSE